MNAVPIRTRAGLLTVLSKDLHARLRRWGAVRDLSPARLRWTASLWLRAAAWPGVIGLSLIAFTLAFYVSAILPAQEQLKRQMDEINSLHDGIQHAARSFADRSLSPAEQLGTFYRFFPRTEGAPEILRRIYEAARAQDIILDQGEYRAMPEHSGKLLRYQITLPVEGPYPQIRKFLATVLAQNPVVALEDVSFEKQKISDRVVVARIRLTVYLRKET